MEKKNLTIILIEDNIEDKNAIKAQFEEAYKWFGGRKLLDELGIEALNIEWLSSNSNTSDDGVYQFYDDNILQVLEERLEIQEDREVLGVLLDVVLTQEEQRCINMNQYENINLSRLIYKKAEAMNSNTYFVTSMRNFGTIGYSIYGIDDLSKMYVPKEVLKEYTSYKIIARAMYYLRNGAFIPLDLERKIEDMEI